MTRDVKKNAMSPDHVQTSVSSTYILDIKYRDTYVTVSMKR